MRFREPRSAVKNEIVYSQFWARVHDCAWIIRLLPSTKRQLPSPTPWTKNYPIPLSSEQLCLWQNTPSGPSFLPLHKTYYISSMKIYYQSLFRNSLVSSAPCLSSQYQLGTWNEDLPYRISMFFLSSRSLYPFWNCSFSFSLFSFSFFRELLVTRTFIPRTKRTAMTVEVPYLTYPHSMIPGHLAYKTRLLYKTPWFIKPGFRGKFECRRGILL